MDENSYPLWVLDLIRLIDKTEYGEIPITLRTHEGRVTSVTTNAFRSKKFKEGENATATAEIVSLIKNMVDSKHTGALSFTVDAQDGHIKKVVTQFHDKKIY